MELGGEGGTGEGYGECGGQQGFMGAMRTHEGYGWVIIAGVKNAPCLDAGTIQRFARLVPLER